jgi:heat shock protein HslJ
MKYALLLLPILAACSAPAPKPAAVAAPVDSATLSAYHWLLHDANDAKGARIDALFARPKLPLQLDFHGGRLGVSNTCNRLGGGYRIDNGRLDVARMAQTLMACADPALTKLDDEIGRRLQAKPRIDIRTASDGFRLRLVTDSGDTLDFVGEPTAETRYGGEGETLFLEVDAQTQPCSHPLIPNKLCLRVRERHYDANGLVAGAPGEWQPLYQDIEGYTHEAGTRNVLRVKRFAVKNVPADAPSQIYVLDMVVESEIVKP